MAEGKHLQRLPSFPHTTIYCVIHRLQRGEKGVLLRVGGQTNCCLSTEKQILVDPGCLSRAAAGSSMPATLSTTNVMPSCALHAPGMLQQKILRLFLSPSLPVGGGPLGMTRWPDRPSRKQVGGLWSTAQLGAQALGMANG